MVQITPALSKAGKPLGAEEVRAALRRVTTSAAFGKAPQLSNFLRYVVEAVLAGKAEFLKGYTIATEALRRDASFDPQTDPIVRVEAGRLRAALGRYYEQEGRRDPVVIELPRGSYVPTIRERRVSHWWPITRKLARTYRELPERTRLILLTAAVAAVITSALDLTWHLVPGDLSHAAMVRVDGNAATPAFQSRGSYAPTVEIEK